MTRCSAIEVLFSNQPSSNVAPQARVCAFTFSISSIDWRSDALSMILSEFGLSSAASASSRLEQKLLPVCTEATTNLKRLSSSM